MTPKITVLMSVHNGLPYVDDAVESILRQTFTEFEFVIVDDASNDGTAEYLRGVQDPRVRLLSLSENIGLTAALNRGLRETCGEFVARQDADDWSDPQRLAKQVAYLQANPRCAVVGSQAQLVDDRGRSLGKKNFPLKHDGICFAHLFDNCLAHSAAMFRRSIVAEAGGYDEAWEASQDYELWSRLSVRAKLANLPQRLVTLRVREGSITQTHRRADLIRRVQAMHYTRVFGRAPSEADLDLISLVRARVVPERLREFRGLLDELVAEFGVARPGALKTTDFWRTLALLHERIGYNLLTLARIAACGELWRALKAWPPAIFSMPWLRIAALGIAGDGIRRLYGKVAR
jgi:glycosyltransferase involved in cell wall biosynthesis